MVIAGQCKHTYYARWPKNSVITFSGYILSM